MAGLDVRYGEGDEYNRYLKALLSTTTDKNERADDQFLDSVFTEVCRALGDAQHSRFGRSVIMNVDDDIIARITDAESDPLVKDRLDYKKYPYHIELHNEYTQQMIRILPSPTREPVAFYSMYEYAGSEKKRITGATELVCENIVPLGILVSNVIPTVFCCFLRKQYGKNPTDYNPVVKLH